METRRVRYLRRLGVILVVWVLGLMTIGSWVKATGSGLACPDWPACYGQWMPPFPSVESNSVDADGHPIYYTQAQVLDEWTHRLVASLLGIPLLLFVVVAASGKELHPALRWLPLSTLATVVVQVGLGGATVLEGNPAMLTTLHLLTATLIFGMVVTATAFAFLRPNRPPRVVTGFPRPASAPPLSAQPLPTGRFPGEPTHDANEDWG
jgi:cytochrome c oxidase assembly protein subunit 15